LAREHVLTSLLNPRELSIGASFPLQQRLIENASFQFLALRTRQRINIAHHELEQLIRQKREDNREEPDQDAMRQGASRLLCSVLHSCTSSANGRQ